MFCCCIVYFFIIYLFIVYRKPIKSGASTSQLTQSTTKISKGILPTPTSRPSSHPHTVPKKTTASGQATVTKAKVLVSKAKNVSTKQIAKMVKTGKVAAKGAVTKVLVKQKPVAQKKSSDDTVSSKKIAPGKSESTVKKIMVVSKEKATVDKSEITSVDKSIKGTKVVTEEEKVSASKAETVLVVQKPKSPPVKVTAAGAMTQEKDVGMATKPQSIPSKSTASENHPEAQTPKLKDSDDKIQQSVKPVPDIIQTETMTVSEPEHHAELAKADVEAKEVKDTEPTMCGVKDAEPVELGQTGVKVAEPMEVDSCTEGTSEKPMATEPVPETPAAKSNENQPLTSTVEALPDVSLPVPPQDNTPKPLGDIDTQTPQATIKSSETSVTASPTVQQHTSSEPESTGQELETKADTSHVDGQVAESPVEAAMETTLTDGAMDTKTVQKGMMDTI